MGSLYVKGRKIWIRDKDETGKWVGAPTGCLAQVDGARRDLLETISHGPRGDIVSVYTTFPWPALCAEIAKLKIELKNDLALLSGSKALATKFATARLKGGNRWRKSVTPSGIEPEIAP